MVNADAKLKEIFGKAQVSMFEMAGLIGKHAKESKNRLFVISHKSKDERASDLSSKARWLLIISVALFAAGLFGHQLAGLAGDGGGEKRKMAPDELGGRV